MDAATTTRPLDGPLIDTFGRVADVLTDPARTGRE